MFCLKRSRRGCRGVWVAKEEAVGEGAKSTKVVNGKGKELNVHLDEVIKNVGAVSVVARGFEFVVSSAE